MICSKRKAVWRATGYLKVCRVCGRKIRQEEEAYKKLKKKYGV